MKTIPPLLVLLFAFTTSAQVEPGSPTYQRMKACIDDIPAIDTHDHLWPFEILPGRTDTEKGNGLNLSSIWRNSYLSWVNRTPGYRKGEGIESWWKRVNEQDSFKNVRATSFYRYTLVALQDLYDVDFESLDIDGIKKLNKRIFDNYRDQRWLYEVITEKANIELMFNDPYWARYTFKTYYPWEVMVFNMNPLITGHHPTLFNKPHDSPFKFAADRNMPMRSLDDYLATVDKMFQTAKAAGAVCLKTTLAYQRTIRFENVPRDRAEKAFGRPRGKLTPEEIKDFEDFMMWRICEFSSNYELPFQIHTGHARIQGSNPMNLVDLIVANPKTKFILFHGGFPWVGEMGMIVMHSMRKGANVWADSVWLPQISYHTAKRAFHEWLDVMPSNRIMWGADCNHAEGIYGSTEFTRRCLAEVLSERIERGELKERFAQQIARQIMRENALELFPQLNERLWKHTGERMTPEK
ncbi:MAG: hypothetical protein CMO80_21300 [Verrucomicrobiales bacterium]|nr:hypothetical protein [Verrucomicrobiales bacterium]|tara:strand:- start:1572 stop:2969 length:1398 start_codon:yes stop_codon:yes gene_type:complete